VRLKGLLLILCCVSIARCSPSASRQLSASGAGAYEASLSATGNGFVAAWYDTRNGHAEIYARALAGDGAPRGPEIRLTTGADAAYEADVAALENHFAVAWYERAASGELRARLGLWSVDGRSMWTVPLGNPVRNSRNVLVRAGTGELFCAWIEDDRGENAEVWAGWFDSNGRAASPSLRLAPAGKTTWNLNAELDRNGEAIVVFDATAGTRSDELFLIRVSRDRVSEVRQLTADDGVPSKYPDVAIGHDRIALTWYDERDGNTEVYLSATRWEDLAENIDTHTRRVTNTPGASIGAYVAWNGRHFGLAWCDDTEGQQEIYYQPFSEFGVAEAEPRRLTFNPTASSIPAIEGRGEGFALAWNEFAQSTSGNPADEKSEIYFTTIP
jgi:hypothetical protein